jgi:Holliday junction DNA helicase RuvA
VIRRLRGTVIERALTAAVVDVHGVGYGLTVLARSAEMVPGAEVDLHVYTHVRDDAIQLFGFQGALDLQLFELLITVPTVGPVKAMAILETRPEDFVAQVRLKDLPRLAKLPGVGKKTAERIVVDLFDKLAQIEISPSRRPALRAVGPREDLVSALINLGFRPGQAEEAADRAIERGGEKADLQQLLKEALTQLAPR